MLAEDPLNQRLTFFFLVAVGHALLTPFALIPVSRQTFRLPAVKFTNGNFPGNLGDMFYKPLQKFTKHNLSSVPLRSLL